MTSTAKSVNGRSFNHFRFIQWDITAKCNLRCIHCRSESFYGANDLEKDMPFEAVRQRLDDLYAAGIRRIHFLGGEPFVRADLPEILRYATELGILCSVNTNGTLITERIAREVVSAGTYLITFSIDGCDAETNDQIRGRGTFRRVLRGIEHVQEARRRSRHKTRLICSHVLMRPNLRTVAGMVDLCTRVGLQNLIITDLRRMGAAIAAHRQLATTDDEKLTAARSLLARMQEGPHCHVQIEILPLLGKLYLNATENAGFEIGSGGCNAASTKAYVQPDGAVFPCQDVAKEVCKSETARERFAKAGMGSWGSSGFRRLADAVSSGSAYAKYVPCNACPALGVLCNPCPLPGLRGQGITHENCSTYLSRAEAEGVDLRASIRRAAGTPLADRLIADPAARRRFFSETGLLEAARRGQVSNVPPELSALRANTLSGVQAILRDSVGKPRPFPVPQADRRQSDGV